MPNISFGNIFLLYFLILSNIAHSSENNSITSKNNAREKFLDENVLITSPNILSSLRVQDESSAYRNAKYDFINQIGMKFKDIKAGVFIKGSCGDTKEKKVSDLNLGNTSANCQHDTKHDSAATNNEFPAHKINLNYDFQIGIFEVTIEQYALFLADTGYLATPVFYAKNTHPRYYPVNFVSFYDSRAFVKWLNEKRSSSDNGFYRLPSESEWEYVAKGNVKTVYWWGNKIIKNVVNCYNCGSRYPYQPHPVGSFDQNPLGAYDMLGNVSEWTTDCMSDNYNLTPRDGYPNLAGNCEEIVAKGGSWKNSAKDIRPASRGSYPPASRIEAQGLRIVRDIRNFSNK